MKRFELSVNIEEADDKYIDMLLVALARCGYSPYISFDKRNVCFEIYDECLTEIKGK